jgi:hypothetical protein
MTLLTGLLIQCKKPWKVFSGRFAINGKPANYSYKLNPAKATKEKMGFPAHVISLAMTSKIHGPE